MHAALADLTLLSPDLHEPLPSRFRVKCVQCVRVLENKCTHF